MPFDNTNEDIRSIKTKIALNGAMYSLLKKTSFRKITNKGICEEALISRAAFYAHFIDKYDLLKYWIVELWPIELISGTSYEKMEETIKCHSEEDLTILKNLIFDADDETLDIIFNFILSTIDLNIENSDSKAMDPKSIILSNFYAGGIITYIFWQIKNKFPTDVPLMNIYLYEIINILKEWFTTEEKAERSLI